MPLDGQGTRAGKTILTVDTIDTMTGFYARYPGLPSRFGTGPSPGSKPVVCLPTQPQLRCNQRGHEADDCDPSCSLYGFPCSKVRKATWPGSEPSRLQPEPSNPPWVGYSVAWKRCRRPLIAVRGPNSGRHCTSPAFTLRSDVRLAKSNPQTWPQNGVRELAYQTDNINLFSNPMSLYVPLSKGTQLFV